MATRLGIWMVAVIDWAFVGEIALGYLAISLLFALSWICAVEICWRRQQFEQRGVGRRKHRLVVRLALPIAKLEKPVTPVWLLESRPEKG